MREAGRGDRPGHAPHDAGRLVLHDDGAAGGHDRLAARATVRTHPREHDSEQVAAEKGPLPTPAPPVDEPTPGRAPLRILLQRKYLLPTLLLVVLWVTQTIGFFGYSSWAPTLLAKHGFSVGKSVFYVALTTVGAPLGSYLAALVTDRFERKWCLVGFGTIIALSGLLYGLTFNPVLIVVFGFLVNLFERGYTALGYAYSPELFDTRQWPQAHCTGRLAGFRHGVPTRVDGTLTLHGVSHPLTLDIRSFKCMPHPIFKREVCGADALATFQRDAYGMPGGKDYGFDMGVTLRIQVEAIQVP